MKFLIVTILVAVAAAEVPPSNRYNKVGGRCSSYPRSINLGAWTWVTHHRPTEDCRKITYVVFRHYLPPPSSEAGYSQGHQNHGFGSEVIAARSFTQGQGHTHGLRNNVDDHSAQVRLGQSEQGYDDNIAGRNALEASDEPANYNFGYMVNDFVEGTDFGHQEERQEEKAQGQYHVVLPDGRKQTVSYEADTRGFNPQISYQDTEDLTRSNGYYESNANTHSNHDNDKFRNGGHNHVIGHSNGY